MARLSLEEMYDDRTLIKKIYDMISIVDSGTFNSLSSIQDGDDITVTFAMNDGTEKSFTFTANGIQNITSEQSGSVMTVNIQLTDGSTKTISWTITPGVTLDTEQTITAAKTLTALLTLTAGLSLTGTTTIDGDVQITNGHSLAVAGDIDAAADISGETLNIIGQGEIAGMAIEPDSSGQTVLSNESGIRSASRVILTNIPTTTTGAVDTAAVNGARLQADLNAYQHMVRTTGDQTVYGRKTFDQTIKGITSISVGTADAGVSGQYKKVVILDKTKMTSIRQHLLLGFTTRQRGRGWDLLTIYLNFATPIGVYMVLRASPENYTYVLSHDDSYIYLTILCNGTLADGVVGSPITATTDFLVEGAFVTDQSLFSDTVPGVEVGRLTP